MFIRETEKRKRRLKLGWGGVAPLPHSCATVENIKRETKRKEKRKVGGGAQERKKWKKEKNTKRKSIKRVKGKKKEKRKKDKKTNKTKHKLVLFSQFGAALI